MRKKNAANRKRNQRLLQAIRTYVNEVGVDPREMIRGLFKEVVETRVNKGFVGGAFIESIIRDEVGRKLTQWRVPQGSGVTKLNELIEKVIREEAQKLLKDHLTIKIDVTAAVEHEGRGIDERRMREGATF
ncbi:hypothetical protein [Sphingomonas sp. NFR04]|uniref:hypothetical protein n=1 Tax=Sphingomonas sp. NFR04 TaxID=1566283 RepID=UPI001113565A|nr:hypothetical protein [Sphingomonas sp. NFR04]